MINRLLRDRASEKVDLIKIAVLLISHLLLPCLHIEVLSDKLTLKRLARRNDDGVYHETARDLAYEVLRNIKVKELITSLLDCLQSSLLTADLFNGLDDFGYVLLMIFWHFLHYVEIFYGTLFQL